MFRLLEVRPIKIDFELQRDDDRQSRRGHRIRALLDVVPGGVDPDLCHPVKRPGELRCCHCRWSAPGWSVPVAPDRHGSQLATPRYHEWIVAWFLW